MKISFFVMTRKGYLSLKTFIEKLGVSCSDCVVASQDVNIEIDYYNNIRELCSSNGIRFYDRRESYVLQSDFCFTISWRWIVDISGCNIIVVHDSLLPRYRGFAPLVSSLINGERGIGVTALTATDGFDRGGILLQKLRPISYPIKIEWAIELVSELYCELIVELGRKLLAGEPLVSTPQDEALATYALWLDEQDYEIDWQRDSQYIKRFVDSVGYPYKGASSLLNGRKVRILEAEAEADVIIENRVPGKVLFVKNEIPYLVCGKGLLKINNLIDEETKESVLPLAKFRSRFY